MELALGALGWTPETFWNSTPYELSNAYIGFCKRHGVGKWEVQNSGWSDQQVADHREATKILMDRFPDRK